MSQGSWQVPTGGSESAVVYAGQCNTAWLALASKNAGGSAPANGPSSAPVQFQDWMDVTDVNFPVDRIYDGANWPRRGTLDVANSNYLPKLGGGIGSLTAAATTDIGSKPQTQVTVNGTTGITSFGTSATVGEGKLLYFSGQLTISNSGNIICPGGADIITQAGDTALVIYQGSGAWIIWAYTQAQRPSGKVTGEMWFEPYASTTRPGSLKANAKTVGDASSNATGLAGTAAWPLFNYLWAQSQDTEITLFTSAGSPTTRGATAAADFAAHKTITLPDWRGRDARGLDTMGTTAASRVTSTTMSPDGQTAGAVGGGQTVTLSTGNLPVFTPSGSIGAITPSGSIGAITPAGSISGSVVIASDAGGSSGGNNVLQQATNQSGTVSFSISASFTGTPVTPTFTGNSVTPIFTGNSIGSATPVNKMPPTKLGTWWIAL